MNLPITLFYLCKTFDCVPLDKLLVKLKHYGLTAYSINIFESYLTNRSLKYVCQFETKLLLKK